MKRKRKSKLKTWIVFSVLVILIVIAATFLMRPASTSYENIVAEIGDITTYLTFSGNVETKNRETVISEKVMQISKINVKDGDIVKAGDVLFETTTGETIDAKISGEIVNVAAEENAPVLTGIKLLEIVDYNNLKINVKVDEYDLASLEKGMLTNVKIGAINKEIKGKISSISKEGQIINGVTFFIATIDLEKDTGIKIGMSAEVKLISDKVSGVVTLPMTAISFDDNNKPYILKNNEKGIAVKKEITTGLNNGTTVEIKSGVTNGENILYTKAKVTTPEGMGFARGNTNRSNVGTGDE
ncbi:MAG: efflux RND transporter periplasmic adaptor subunit [Ruminiclostridium sp.]